VDRGHLVVHTCICILFIPQTSSSIMPKCSCVCACVCVHVYEKERERERERGSESAIERKRERKSKRARERARKRERNTRETKGERKTRREREYMCVCRRVHMCVACRTMPAHLYSLHFLHVCVCVCAHADVTCVDTYVIRMLAYVCTCMHV